jgi:ElaB/YqjD/DUF883 family membrane-anchored ribosome-binding protein
MSGGAGFNFNIPEFLDGSRQLSLDGTNASQQVQGGVDGFNPPRGQSPQGQAAGTRFAGYQGILGGIPQTIGNGANDNNQRVQRSLQEMQGIDGQNAGLVDGASKDPMDPQSIDQDAQKEAKDMLDGDKTDQQMEQILQQMLQAGMQGAQQVSQQIGQLVNQLNQAMNQVVQQVSQIASQAVGQAASHAAENALNAAASGLGDGLGAGGGAGAGAGAGTIPAGLEEPVTPMTTSPALVQGTGPVAPTAAPASAAGARMPMMPMMPMHGRQGEKDRRKRNPNIFPEGRIYEPPAGTVQNFGANPEIDAEAPPFGTSKSA